MTDLFISDVHVSPDRPAQTDRLIAFLASAAGCCERLFVLGDFFDLWLGDDDDRPPHAQVVAALKALTDGGVAVFVMFGNHDFLLGTEFEAQTGCQIINDPSVVSVQGSPVALMHGDTLCTDDIEYQKFRAYARNPDVQREFLKLGLAERLERANLIRRQSREATPLKPSEIMDVNQPAVTQAMRDLDVNTVIHGHTHRPGMHTFDLDGGNATRIVLGDWYADDPVGLWDAEGFRRVSSREFA